MPNTHPSKPATQWLEQACGFIQHDACAVPIDDEIWAINTKADNCFLVEWFEDWHQFVMTADLGVPAPPVELRALNLALSYNALWAETGSIRLARDGDDGVLMLLASWTPDDGSPEQLAQALEHFARLQEWWVGALSQLGTPADAALPDIPQWLLARA